MLFFLLNNYVIRSLKKQLDVKIKSDSILEAESAVVLARSFRVI